MAENVASEDAALAEALGVLAVPPIVVVPQERDRVQARRVLPSTVEGAPDDVEVREFTIARINAAGEYVSALGRTAPAEWEVEVLARAPIELPRRKTKIEAVLVDGTTVTLTGKQGDWRDDDFDPIEADSIRSFEVIDPPAEPVEEEVVP